jgi:hypothetical protein
MKWSEYCAFVAFLNSKMAPGLSRRRRRRLRPTYRQIELQSLLMEK